MVITDIVTTDARALCHGGRVCMVVTVLVTTDAVITDMVITDIVTTDTGALRHGGRVRGRHGTAATARVLRAGPGT
jgi:hypothetical protein